MLKKNAAQTNQQLTQLPILRNSERTLNELRPRASTSLNHVLRVVERDPALAFELFTTVNRNLKQAGKPQATNIRRAILVFGVARYLDHCKSFQTIEQDLPPQFLRPVFNHLGRSYLSACLAQTLARARGGINPEDAFCFGLARDLDSYASKLIDATKISLDMRNARTLLPGLTSPTINGDPLHWCAEIAFKFSSTCQYASDESALSPLIETIAGNFSLGPKAIRSIVVKTIISAAAETKHFNDFPAARFMMNPGPQAPTAALQFPSPKKNSGEKDNNKAPSSYQQELSGQAEQTRISEEKTPTQTQYLLDAKQLKRATLKIDKTVENLALIGSTVATRTRAIPFALNAMVSVMQANKVLFIAHPADEQLIAQIKIGEDKKPTAMKLPLNLDNNLILRKILTSQKSRHVTIRQLQQHNNLFDAKLTTFLGSNEAYCIPLVGKKKTIGIILACFDQKTTQDWTTHFKLSNEIATHLVQTLNASSE